MLTLEGALPHSTAHHTIKSANHPGKAVPSKLRDQRDLIDTFQFPGDRYAEGQLLTPGFQERGQSNPSREVVKYSF